MDRWFFLGDGAASGAENMARDEFLLQKVQREGCAPVLRLYSFDPPAVTIGFHQDPSRILDLEALRLNRVDLVRRITGGRVFLHDGELTYCVVASRDSAIFGSGLRDAFMRISEALTAALLSLGVDAIISSGRSFSTGGGLESPCLVSISRYEITTRGRKIVGSAQRRTASALLQHGSILLEPSSKRVVDYVKGDWHLLGDRVTSVSEELGASVDDDKVRGSILNAFSEIFEVEWERLKLSKEDKGEIERRIQDKKLESYRILGMEVAG